MKTKKATKKVDGLLFQANGRTWVAFAPGWRLWRWFGWLLRRLRGVPSCSRRLRLPEGERLVRGEPGGPTLAKAGPQGGAAGLGRATTKLARQAPLGVKRAP